jgi:hypothetical protein
MLRNKLIILILLLTTHIASCFDAATHSNPTGNTSSTFSCTPAKVTIEGEPYTFHSHLASGSFGLVFNLANSKLQISKDYVAKIIPSLSKKSAKIAGASELELSRLLNLNQNTKLAAQTTQYGIHTYKNPSTNALIYTPIVIKKRINGPTLKSVMRSKKPTSQLMYDSFLDFRAALIEKLAQLAKDDRFIADLHEENILFDGQKWIVIDGYVFLNKRDFRNYVTSSYEKTLKNNKSYQDLIRFLSDDLSWYTSNDQTKKDLFAFFIDTETQNARKTLKVDPDRARQ